MATKEVKIKDKTFVTSISEETILRRVKELAEEISRDYADKNPLFLAVLNGSFVFAADLMRDMAVPCEISFVKLASYHGTMSTGKVKEVIGINEDLSGRHVDHQFVGDELTLVDIRLGCLAKFCSVFDFATKHIAC